MANTRNRARKRPRKFYGKKKTNESAPTASKTPTPPSPVSDNTNFGFLLFDFGCLVQLISFLACPECQTVGTVSVCFLGHKRNGLAVCMKLICSSCEYESNEMYSSKKVSKYFEINRRVAYASRAVGIGHSEINKLCYLLGLPSVPNKSAYQRHIKEINAVIKVLATDTMNDAAASLISATGRNECAVAVDGTWQRRGFSSLVGVVTAVSVKTGKVLDVEVMTKDCMSCRMYRKKDKNSPSYQTWKTNHKCAINYEGSSPNMEPVGAGRLFLRSIQLRGLTYSEYLGDGDSKSFKTVCDLDPYDGIKIEKLECVGHYQKRVGKALRQLVACQKLGGKGKLTQALIDKLQNYFGIALRSSTGSVEQMYKAIWASLFHVAANDKQPLHAKCPLGEDSWCSYQVAKAKGVPYKHKGPGIPIEILRKIKPAYERLTDKKMLQKCLHGKTQNINESFNGMIWRRCPKETYSGRYTVELAVMDAVCHFNKGPEVELDIYKKMGIEPGTNMMTGVASARQNKEFSAKKHSTPDQKTRRRYLRGRKKMKLDTQTASEGVTYDPGAF